MASPMKDLGREDRRAWNPRHFPGIQGRGMEGKELRFSADITDREDLGSPCLFRLIKQEN